MIAPNPTRRRLSSGRTASTHYSYRGQQIDGRPENQLTGSRSRRRGRLFLGSFFILDEQDRLGLLDIVRDGIIHLMDMKFW